MSDQNAFLYCKLSRTVIAPNSIKQDPEWEGIEAMLASLGCSIAFMDDERMSYYLDGRLKGE